MVYIYDILLNWNDNLYDFYEWNNTDQLTHVKRMPIFKVSRKDLNNIKNNEVNIDPLFINKAFNLTEVYTTRKVIKINYAFILSDGELALAISTDNLGKIKEKSLLLMDEEQEVLILTNRLNQVDISYSINKKIDINRFITRKEKEMKKFLEKELKKTYNNKDYDKLKYLYTEYSNIKEDNINNMYSYLLESLNSINENHNKIYSLLQLITNKN